jgi:lipopolysaccharide/colanic/teichoic acid biosynthesis glycosyltransferase
MYKHFFKRVFDFVLAGTALLLLSPVFIIVMVLLCFANDGKPFFFQTRPKKGGKLFTIIKFKTMNDRKDAEGNLLTDGERLTKIGKFVRSLSLDELPQLINVLKGDMAIIGPRPLLEQYLPLYNERQSKRHEVRPGITGWAQVNGRNAISWQEKFELDVFYVEHVSLWLDVQILFRTVLKVIRREGINSDSNTTMEYFTGNK